MRRKLIMMTKVIMTQNVEDEERQTQNKEVREVIQIDRKFETGEEGKREEKE